MSFGTRSCLVSGCQIRSEPLLGLPGLLRYRQAPAGKRPVQRDSMSSRVLAWMWVPDPSQLGTALHRLQPSRRKFTGSLAIIVQEDLNVSSGSDSWV